MDRNEIERIFGTNVYDIDGDKIGVAAQVYADDESGEPEWVTVRTGLFGTRESFVPLGEASLDERGLTVPFAKDVVKDAPNHDADGHLTPEDENDLYAYYGSGARGGDRRSDPEAASRHDEAGPVEGPERAGLEAEHATDDRPATGVGRDPDRLRLRKVVVTENVTVTVPVQREEVRVEQDPAAGTDLHDEQTNRDSLPDERR